MNKLTANGVLIVGLALIAACVPISPDYATAPTMDAANTALPSELPEEALSAEDTLTSQNLSLVQGSSMADPIRITFSTGQTTATESGNVTPEFSPQYVINILAGQSVEMHLQSDGDWANFSVVGVTDGVMYKTAADLLDDFSFRTTRHQDYMITIVSSRPQNYTLTIHVAPLAQPTPQPSAPVEIRVPAGATGTSISGTTPPYGTDRYAADAQRGQVMTVSLQSQGAQLRFDVVDLQTGAVLEPLNDPNPVWSGALPETGSFQIDVVSNVDFAVDYTLHVDFSPIDSGGSTSAPERIQFAPGAITADVSGTVVPPTAKQYILEAGAGQLMTVNVSPWGAVGISVYGADGTVLQSPMGGLPSFSGTLPSTQDYVISLTSLTGGGVDFTMEVTIQ